MHLFNLCFAASVLFTACALPLPTRCCWPDLRARDDVVSNAPPLNVEFHTSVPDEPEIRKDIAAQVVAQHQALQFETAGPAQQAKKATFAKVQKAWADERDHAEFYFHDGYPNDNNRIGPMRTVTPLTVNMPKVQEEHKAVIDSQIRLSQARFPVGHEVRAARVAAVGGEGWHTSKQDSQMHVRVQYHSWSGRGRHFLGTAHVYEPGKPGPDGTGDGRTAADNYFIPKGTWKGTWKEQDPKTPSPKITTPAKPGTANVYETGKSGPAGAAGNYYVPGGTRKVQYQQVTTPVKPGTAHVYETGKPGPAGAVSSSPKFTTLVKPGPAGTGDGRKAADNYPKTPSPSPPVKPELQGKKLSYLQAAKNG